MLGSAAGVIWELEHSDRRIEQVVWTRDKWHVSAAEVKRRVRIQALSALCQTDVTWKTRHAAGSRGPERGTP